MNRKRECVLQVDVDRSAETTGVTSRERITHLEASTSQLWDVVRRMQSRLGNPEVSPDDDAASAAGQSIASERSEEVSPMAAPTHLKQLFDNEFVDTRTDEAQPSVTSSDRISGALFSRARSRLREC